jgi:hypothetical protein
MSQLANLGERIEVAKSKHKQRYPSKKNEEDFFIKLENYDECTEVNCRSESQNIFKSFEEIISN